jgi:CheY-like chemotaxis protein
MLLDSPASVLVLSDDASFVMLVRTVAEDTARAVRRTNTSSVLGDLAREPCPSVLVLDITVDTAHQRWALLDMLAADAFLSTIPVVVTPAASELLTGHAALLRRSRLQVWSEPFDPDDLLAAIEHVQSNPKSRR